jgi:hypothetical protein
MRAHRSDHHFATIQGRRLAYRIAGRADGSPIVLIHALASRSESWDATAGALAELGFRVIAPDLRGHGRSDWANSYALIEFENDLVGLLPQNTRSWLESRCQPGQLSRWSIRFSPERDNGFRIRTGTCYRES